jgi:hypothetical protein
MSREQADRDGADAPESHDVRAVEAVGRWRRSGYNAQGKIGVRLFQIDDVPLPLKYRMRKATIRSRPCGESLAGRQQIQSIS